jgi:hypothetical protein
MGSRLSLLVPKNKDGLLPGYSQLDGISLVGVQFQIFTLVRLWSHTYAYHGKSTFPVVGK